MIHLQSFLHTMSAYANRWGGPRYRTEELAKFFNKHLYNIQEDQLRAGSKVNTILAHDAFLSSRHTPVYMSSIKAIPKKRIFSITDELGFTGLFPEGTEILIINGTKIEFNKIENIKPGDKRIINLELVPRLKNDKMHHHREFSENFLSIKYKSEYEKQMLLCDCLSAMTILKDEGGHVSRVDQFNPKNLQEIYLVDVTEVKEVETSYQFYEAEFLPFSYVLMKNRALSDKSKNRYWKYRHQTIGKRWLEKMRSKVFSIKKSKVEFKMDLKHVKNSN
jgi:hypothetical protein